MGATFASCTWMRVLFHALPGGPRDGVDMKETGNPAGFTLVELLIVLVVVGVMATLALPALGSGRPRSESGVQVLVGAMLTAQRMAVTSQRNVVVAFDTAADVLWVHQDGNNDGVVDEGERRLRVELGDGVTFGAGTAPARGGETPPVTFEGRQDGLPAVTFMRNGGLTEAGAIYVTTVQGEQDVGRAEDARLITVARATGRTDWFRYEAGEWQRGG